ncbi:MAG: ATP-binding cassette domain-containing protein [Kiritimatiellia bacterium]
MPDDVVITCDRIGKRYRLGAAEQRSETLAGALLQGLRRPFRHLLDSLRAASEQETLWALKDISFEVRQGEVMALVGRNGAGKSTLLKILSRITDPTEGRVEMLGRVNALLEVGTGFHPELTGRENIYLSAAIHGMRKAAVDRELEAIIDFAGIEKFIDTPVKRYSSGMAVRLGFAVAAHPAGHPRGGRGAGGGDPPSRRSAGGRRCGDAGGGRTVLFVSHNLSAVSRLCGRGLLLEQGRKVLEGTADEVVSADVKSSLGSQSERHWDHPADAPGNEVVRLRSVRMIDRQGGGVESLDIREAVGVELVLERRATDPAFVPTIMLHNEHGVHVFNAIDTNAFWSDTSRLGLVRSVAWIPGNFLSEGTHFITVIIISFAPQYSIRHVDLPEAIAFQVVDAGEGDSARGSFMGQWGGACRPKLHWDHQLLHE